MKILGKSEFGMVAMCEKCNCVWHLEQSESCPHCSLKEFNDRSRKPPYSRGGKEKAFHRKVY